MANYTVGKINARDIDLDALDCAIDTAGSWDGDFPDPGEGDFLVTLAAWDREEETVLVSRRYTSAINADDAAELALDAFAERHDYERDDEGNILPITIEGTEETGIPVWVVRVEAVEGSIRNELGGTADEPVEIVVVSPNLGDCPANEYASECQRLQDIYSNLDDVEMGYEVYVRPARHGEAEGTYYTTSVGSLQILGHTIPIPDDLHELGSRAWEEFCQS